MSRRYGRNQKRRHRERIEFLETLDADRVRVIDMIGRDRDRANNALRVLHEALNRVNPYSSFLPPRALSVHPDTLRYGPLNVESRKQFPVNLRPETDYPALDAPDVRQIPFYEVKVEIDTHPERYQTCCHLILNGYAGHERVSYFIDEGARRDLKHNGAMGEDFVRLIAVELITHLAGSK